MGESFQESTNELLVLDTQDMMLPFVFETVKTLESVGQKLFSSHPLKSKSNEKRHAALLMQNVALFSQM